MRIQHRPWHYGSAALGCAVLLVAVGIHAAQAGTATGSVPSTVAPRTTVSRTTGSVTVLTNLPYAKASKDQTLDLLLPPHAGRRIPLVIWIHGGAFVGGDKTEGGPKIDTLVASGFAVARINYRMTGTTGFPSAIKDAKAAVRWLRAHANGYGLRADQFAVWGESAGGYLATMVGVTGGRRTAFDAPELGNPTVSSAVQAVVDQYGPVNFLTMDKQSVSPGGCPGDWWQRHDVAGSPESAWLGAPIGSVPAKARTANPITYLSGAGRLPAFSISHGSQDCNVPYGQSMELVAALRKRRASVTFTLVPGVGHAEPAFDDVMTAPTVGWLHRLFDRH